MQTDALLWISKLTVIIFGFSQVLISCFCVLSIAVHVWVSLSALRVQPVFSHKWLCRKCFWRTWLVFCHCRALCWLSIMDTKGSSFELFFSFFLPPGGERVQCLHAFRRKRPDANLASHQLSRVPTAEVLRNINTLLFCFFELSWAIFGRSEVTAIKVKISYPKFTWIGSRLPCGMENGWMDISFPSTPIPGIKETSFLFTLHICAWT